MKNKNGFMGCTVIPFILTAVVCFIMEVSVSLIPPSAIVENVQDSALYYRMTGIHPEILEDRMNTRKNHNGDSILLNLMYQQDPKHPIKSVILVPYLDEDSLDAIMDCVAASVGGLEANAYHFRYWHGSMVWLKPLLCVMDITEIYRVYGFIIIGFTLLFFIRCLVKRKAGEGVCYLITFIIIGGCMTISCTEYANIMIVMMAMIPLFLTYGKRGEKELLTLCVIDGVITCFIDFLTVETITLTVPLGILLLLENTHLKEGNRKNQVVKTMKALFSWGISYAAMFLVKWLLATTMIGWEGLRNSFMRTNEHMKGYQLESLYYNILMLFPWKRDISGAVQMTSVIIFIIGVIITIFRLWKKGQMGLLILLLIPYIRFVVVGSHSYFHYYYTYRAQMITVLVMVFVVWEFIKEKKGKKQGI